MTQLKWAVHILGRWSSLTSLGVIAAAAVWGQSKVEFAPTTLARGVQQVRDRAFAQAESTLQGLPAKLPQLADYAAFHLAQAHQEQKNWQSALAALGTVYRYQPVSPYAWRAVAMAAHGLNESGRSKEAIALVKQYYKIMPQASAEASLARSYEAAGDLVSAAVAWQQVYYQFPASDPAGDAGDALGRLKLQLGDKYPPAMSQDMLRRAKGLADARRYQEAKRELEHVLPVLAASERDLARVRVGVMEYQSRQYLPAYQYLRALDVADGEPDAERLYHLTFVAKRLDREVDMKQHLKDLERKYPNSVWRQEALVTAAYLYLSRNEESEYEPLYRACSTSSAKSPQSSFCDWKLTWNSYLRQAANATTLFQNHLRKYPTSEKAPASLYFLARQAESQNDFGTARAYYEALDFSIPNHYYAMLARERLETAALAKVAPSASGLEFLKSVDFPNRRISMSFEPTRATSQRLERARLLNAAGLTDLAESELRFAARADGQPQIIAMELAKLLDRRGAHDEALRAVKAYVPNYLNMPFDGAPVSFWRVAFPMPYKTSVERYSREKELDPYVVAGLIRQESEFNPKAISVAKAYGLTQVLPSTGRYLSRNAGISRFVPSMLFQPEINLRLGTHYMRQLLNSFQASWERTLAAYNGGPTRVSRWINWASFREPSEFIETIPIQETRDYVQIVLRNASVYRKIYGPSAVAAR